MNKLYDYIVTGSSGLVGTAVIKDLEENGFEVLELDLESGIDLTNEKTVKAIFEQNRGKNLVNFFAINEKYSKSNFNTSFLDFELSYFLEVLNVNLVSLFSVNREFIRNNFSGTITNISSIYGVVSPNPKLYQGGEKPIAYGVSKAGVIQMSKHLAVHAAPHFRVNCLVIGGVLENQDKQFVKNYSRNVPLGRMAHAEEICSAIKFLAADESSYITGSVVTIDGGWTAL